MSPKTTTVGSHRTCRFVTDVSLGCRDNLRPQINRSSLRAIRVDCDKMLRIERQHEREKAHVAREKYDENLHMCRFSSNLCFSHVHVIRTSPGEKFAVTRALWRKTPRIWTR